jgi:hypothetical protein
MITSHTTCLQMIMARAHAYGLKGIGHYYYYYLDDLQLFFKIFTGGKNVLCAGAHLLIF